jgi:hypothetical protein
MGLTSVSSSDDDTRDVPNSMSIYQLVHPNEAANTNDEREQWSKYGAESSYHENNVYSTKIIKEKKKCFKFTTKRRDSVT